MEKNPILNHIKSKKLFLIILIGLIIIIGIVLVSQSKVKAMDPVMKCMTEKAKLYVQTGCPACDKQKQVLGEDYQLFKPIDCKYKQQECSEAGIQAIPTWIINNQQYKGAKTLEQIKELTSC